MSNGRTDPAQRLTGWRAAVVWVVAVSGFVAIGLGQILNPDSLIVVLIIGAVIESFGLVGAILVVRLPGNPVGWLLWASGAALAWAVAGVTYATHSGLACGGCLPATVPIALIANAGFAPILGAVGIFLPLLFPDGRLPSPRWRPVAWLGLAAIVMFTSMIGFAPGPISAAIPIENPVGFTGLGEFFGLFGIVATVTLLVSMVLALVSVIWRFRHSDAIERQQLRWFGYAGLGMVAAVAVGLIAPWESAWVLIFAGLGLLPLATGVAILRYRLYDLDRLVSRTIAYATVVGILLAVFAGGILIFQAALEPLIGKNGAGVAASTLLVVALFQPLLRRVKARVDRRFNRGRYDAERTVTAFAGRLRDEVDLASLGVDIRATVIHTVEPASVSLWLRE
jgi:hypothetical protein